MQNGELADQLLHKSSVNTLASQSTLSFHTSNVTVNAPIKSPATAGVIRRNHGTSGHPNGLPGRGDHLSAIGGIGVGAGNTIAGANGIGGGNGGIGGLAASQRISVFEPYPLQVSSPTFIHSFH